MSTLHSTEKKQTESMKHRIFTIIQIGQESDLVSRIFDVFIVAVILVNILVLFMETFSELSSYQHVFRIVEGVTVFIFILEYILRLWTSCYLYPNMSKARAVLRFIISFDGVIELLTILPFFFLSGFVAFRMLRVVRIFHLFRINSHYDSFNVIRTVLYSKKNQLLSSIFIILVMIMASSLCMYSAEHPAQPEVFRNAFSGFWWSVSTLLTVGYGDIYPITPLGQVMAIIISFLGVLAVAIPTGIISAGFVEQYTDMQNSNTPLGDINLQTVILDIDSAWLGHTIQEIRDRYSMVIVMARRGDTSFAPNQDFIPQVGDVLIVFQE